MRELLRTSPSVPLALVRFTLGLVMLMHGAQKMLGWWGGPGFSGTMGFFESMGIPAPFAFLAIVAEFFGGLGLMIGFLARIAAFGIMVEMIVAIAMVHARNGLFMNWTGKQGGEGFEFHLLAIGMALAVIIGGAGAYSVDLAILHAPGRPVRVA
ncbi:MAG TPA: DoxX family protein [Candidatus Acidoferrum sp.]|nr:DoxX family protein [Candidatus Acidoferrum sp.]